MIRIAGILTVFSIAATVFGQTGAADGTGSAQSLVSVAASLQVKGKVTVNQQLISETSTAITEGDFVETGPFAAARIAAPGLSVYLPANSCLKYSNQRLEVCNCGSADVSARKPVSLMLRDSNLVVSSQGQGTAFVVSIAGNELDVVNQAGIVNVSRNGVILTQINAHSSRTLAGFGCRTPANNFTSAAGAAAAIAVPGAIAGVVILRSTNRQPVSSLAP